MKGLVYKDVMTIARQMKFFFLLVAVFALTPELGESGFAIIYTIGLPFSAVAYDERSKWNQLAVMMPYSDLQLVLSKYVLGGGFIALATLVTMIGQYVGGALGATGLAAASIPSAMLTYFSVALLLQALTLPVMFRFGAERGRMGFILIIVLGAAAAGAAAKLTAGTLPSLSPAVVGFGLFALAAAANAVSVPLSCKFFRRGLRA